MLDSMLRALPALSCLIPPKDRYYFSSPFTNETDEPLKDEVTCSWSWIESGREPGFKLKSV